MFRTYRSRKFVRKHRLAVGFASFLLVVLIGFAVTTMQILKNRVFSDPGLSEAAMMAKGKVFAAWSLIFWVGAVTAGRLLAYTYTYVSYLG